jgi:transposase-like protein
VPRAGPKKVRRYSLEFKLKAVKLSQLKGVEVQAVAARIAKACRCDQELCVFGFDPQS